MNLKSLGWVVAFALLAVFVGGGFDTAGTKIGVVDIAKVFNNSDYAAKQDDLLKAYGESRSSVLDFLSTYQVGTAAQATRIRDLSVENPQPDADKNELDRVKKEVMAQDAAYKTLLTKQNPTSAEVQQINDFNGRVQATQGLLKDWSTQFEDDVNNYKEKLRAATMDRVQTAIKGVGVKGGYTILFSADAAPFGANDLTDDALKSMNAQK